MYAAKLNDADLIDLFDELTIVDRLKIGSEVSSAPKDATEIADAELHRRWSACLQTLPLYHAHVGCRVTGSPEVLHDIIDQLLQVAAKELDECDGLERLDVAQVALIDRYPTTSGFLKTAVKIARKVVRGEMSAVTARKNLESLCRCPDYPF